MTCDVITPMGYAPAVVGATLDAMLDWLRAQAQNGPLLVGLSGLQGSGKSTFAHQLGAAAKQHDLRTEVLSLDDFYLARRERLRLAHEVHPLLATRGVPGTHDVGLMTHTLEALARASARRPVRIPRFDKGRDTRLPPSRWRSVEAPPRLILLEGWCIGVPPQPAPALTRPINTLERDEDPDARWRRWVNRQLADTYVELWRRLDRLILLEASSFAVVTRWRDEQERVLRTRHAPHAMDERALRRFLMHYERLSRCALATLPTRADLRLVLRRDRTLRALVRAT